MFSLFNGNFFAGVSDGGQEDTAVRAVSKLFDKCITVHGVRPLSTATADWNGNVNETVTMSTMLNRSLCVSVCAPVNRRFTALVLLCTTPSTIRYFCSRERAIQLKYKMANRCFSSKNRTHQISQLTQVLQSPSQFQNQKYYTVPTVPSRPNS